MEKEYILSDKWRNSSLFFPDLKQKQQSLKQKQQSLKLNVLRIIVFEVKVST